MKILGLDDSILKDISYYPYDMVHFKMNKFSMRKIILVQRDNYY